MGGGSKSKSNSVSYSGSSNPAFAPYAIQGVNSVNKVFNAAQPGLDALTNTTQNTVVPGALGNYNSSSALAGQGRAFNSDVLSGKYLNGNPYIDSILAQTREDIGNSVGGHFSTSGRYGSGANQALMEKQMANAENALRYQNYGAEMDRMSTAAQAGQTGSTADLAGLLQALGQGAEMPYTGSSSLANSLGALFSGGQDKSNSSSKGPSPIWGAIGSGLGAAAAFASDRRLKKDIEEIGLWDGKDELKRYQYRYRFDPSNTLCEGVMADEVKELRPAAYVENYRDGFAGVNYAAL